MTYNWLIKQYLKKKEYKIKNQRELNIVIDYGKE